MKGLTKKQKEFLEYVKRHPKATLKELANEFNISINGAAKRLNTLEKRGYIIRQIYGGENSKGIEIVDGDITVLIPYHGVINI